MESQQKTFLVVLIIAALAIFGYVAFSSPSSDEEDFEPLAATPEPQLAPALQLTAEERAGDVSEKKAQIMARVRSGAALTQEERAEIGGIMLTKANIYNFSEEERAAIFAALNRR